MQVLDIIIQHVFEPAYNFTTVARLSRVDKATAVSAKLCITSMRDKYFKRQPNGKEIATRCAKRGEKCNTCGRSASLIDPFSDKLICKAGACREPVMCRTDAKKTYWLNDNDLGYLNYLEYIHPRSKYNVNAFQLSDVKNLAFSKHGTQDAVIIRDMKNNKNASLVKRKKQMGAMLCKVDENDRNAILNMTFCQQFIKGGALAKVYGARVLDKFIGSYPVFASNVAIFRVASPSFSDVSHDQLALFSRLVYTALDVNTCPVDELAKIYKKTCGTRCTQPRCR